MENAICGFVADPCDDPDDLARALFSHRQIDPDDTDPVRLHLPRRSNYGCVARRGFSQSGGRSRRRDGGRSLLRTARLDDCADLLAELSNGRLLDWHAKSATVELDRPRRQRQHRRWRRRADSRPRTRSQERQSQPRFCLPCQQYLGYGHFRIEHNRGHHTWVSTAEDPASARYGESIYRFAARELPGAFRRGWLHEAQRLQRRGKSAWSIESEILQGYAFTLVVAAALIAVFGWKLAPFIVAHHLIGWYSLTQANYVEHYGLLRQKLPHGRYEPVQPRHSWNTNHIFSNLATFHLQRHSDHHANPMRPYQSLRDFKDLPRLPSGYPGMFALAAIPPLWFKVMNPRVMEWAGGNFANVNAVPGAKAG